MMFKRFEIDLKDALREYKASGQFMQRLISGRYVYVEKSICLNLPKYVVWVATIPALTDYARAHKDECCLVFTTVITGGWAGGHSKNLIYMVPAPSVSGPAYYDEPEKVSEQIQMFAETSSAVLSLASELPNNFSKMLDKLIRANGVKEEDLAETSNLSEKTIQRLRNHDPKDVSLETVLQLCIGLHLHPVLSGYLLRAAGQRFMDTDLHNMYRFLLSTYYGYSVHGCNTLLESQGFPTLGREKS